MAQKIKTEQASYDTEGKVQVRLGYMMDEIRAALVDVRDPGTMALVFKKDSDGYASRELVAFLENHGIVSELMQARQASVNAGPSKKS